MLDLRKRDEPRGSNRVLDIVISPVILKLFAKEINDALFLLC